MRYRPRAADLASAVGSRQTGSRPPDIRRQAREARRAWLVAENVCAAIRVSHLRSLLSEVIAGLAVDASRSCIPAGSTVHREGDPAGPPRGGGVGGDASECDCSPMGRMMTVRCCRPGSLIGVVSLFASPFALPLPIPVVTDTGLLAFRPSVVQRAADRDPRLARALLVELSERVLSFITEISGSAFATVRQRIARHLLDLGTRESERLAARGRDQPAGRCRCRGQRGGARPTRCRRRRCPGRPRSWRRLTHGHASASHVAHISLLLPLRHGGAAVEGRWFGDVRKSDRPSRDAWSIRHLRRWLR